jgi:dihydroxyacetone kinase
VNGAGLVALLDAALPRLATSADELRDLDAALGDGDLGITVSKGCAAVQTSVGALDEPTPQAVLRAAGTAFSSANPSTFAALVGGGLLAAAKAVGDAPDLDAAGVVTAGRAFADRIVARGKAEPGDKTLLDALLPSLDALEQGGDAPEVLARMVAAADEGVRSTAPLVSQRGRAAWVGERGAGSPDPGATAWLRFLQAVAASWPGA